MVYIICRRQDFTFIDIINFNGFQNLGFRKMANTALRHNRNRNRFLNPFNHGRITHTGHAASRTDIRWNSFQSHDGTGTCRFRNLCLFRSSNIHNNTALKHLCQLAV